MNSTLNYSMSVILALFLHGGVIALMLANWETEKTIEVQDNKTYYLEASVVSENPHTAKKIRDKKTDKRRQNNFTQSANNQALRRENIKREQIEIAELKAEAERQAIEDAKNRELNLSQSALIEAERQNNTVKIDEELEAARREMASELDSAIEGEQLALRAITDDEKASAFVGQIQREIIQNWSRPPSARNGMQAILRVFLVPTGDVVNVVVEESSGNDAFDRSALLAVNKARRFLVPSDSRQFEKNFRQFVVLFRPEDLRL